MLAMNKPTTAKVAPKPVHPFPARMAAAIPWEELSVKGKGKLRVLDPMAGSGTTLAVARVLGHEAIGFDTDPLAVLIARAWCENVDTKRLRLTARRMLRRATDIYTSMRAADAYPDGSDDETRRFVRYWFDRRNRKELTALSRVIRRVRDEQLRVLLLCAFSRLIIAKQAGASLALDLAHSRPHRVRDKPTVLRPLQAFLAEVERICAVAPFGQRCTAPRARILEGDVRALPLANGSVDVVITSPPYVNGIDYQRTTKFSLVWIGHTVGELRRVRAQNIGTEAAGRAVDASDDAQRRALKAMGVLTRAPARTTRILGKFVRDMDDALKEVARVLAHDGRAVVVIGDSTIRRTDVRNSRALLILAASHGLKKVRIRRRRLPPNRRYLPPPRAKAARFDKRLRTEVILHLRKCV